MLEEISKDVINFVFKFTVQGEHKTAQLQPRQRPLAMQRLQTTKASATGAIFKMSPEQSDNMQNQDPTETKKIPIKVGPKIGRNDPCPCAAAKKYKNCHGKFECFWGFLGEMYGRSKECLFHLFVISASGFTFPLKI